MQRKISRRQVLKAGSVSAAAAGFWLTGGVTESFAAQPGANERLNIAIIGCGGQGGSNAGQQVVRAENIVALCDVDSNRARTVFDRYPNVPKYTDFRVMYEKQKDIQAVIVSTPDHMHFHATAMALQRDKHVYTEKPLTHDVWETRQLKILAAKHRVATSMGNMGTASNGIREAAEIIRAGAIGEVREVHVWTNRPVWPQGMARPKATHEVPKTLQWDLWLGTAPQRPFNSERQVNGNPTYAPFNWRGWWDFGTGALGDMACHTMNLAFMALRLGAPTSVSAEVVGGVNAESAPARGATVTYEFPARGNGMPACRLYWYESPYQPNTPAAQRVYRRPPAAVLEGVANVADSGCMLVGNKGKLYSGSDYGASYTLLPRADFAEYRPPQPTIPRSPGHHAEWIRACKGGAAPMTSFVEYACPLTELVLLGNVAMRTGQRIRWDSEKLQAIDLPAAAQYIRRTYRKGWEWNA